MPGPGAVGRRARAGAGRRQELEASVVWRSGYAPASGGKLVTPRIALPGAVDYPTHRDAASAMRQISPDLVFRYFQGCIVYENGQVSSEFTELV